MTNEPKWLIVARAEQAKNIHEFPGEWQDNPEIMKYFKDTSYAAHHDEVPWCAAFVGWCLQQAGIKPSGSAAAASYEDWGEDLGETPVLGCIVVLPHHVTFYVGHVGTEWVTGLGGNQHDSVKESNYPVGDVISYRWPKEA